MRVAVVVNERTGTGQGLRPDPLVTQGAAKGSMFQDAPAETWFCECRDDGHAVLKPADLPRCLSCGAAAPYLEEIWMPKQRPGFYLAWGLLVLYVVVFTYGWVRYGL